MYDIEKELQELRNKIDEIEKKYAFVTNYQLITAILNKLNIDELEITGEELNNNIMYIVESDMENNKFTVKKYTK